MTSVDKNSELFEPRSARTPLFGRDSDLRVVSDLVLGPAGKIVTLIGPPGVGKSRLAEEFVSTARSRLRNGVHWVDLSTVDDHEIVSRILTAAIAEAGHGTGEDHQPEAVPQPRALLVINDCDLVVSFVASVLRAVVPNNPHIRILVTCRESLRLYGETILSIAPFPIPAPDLPLAQLAELPAIRLFAESARRVSPRFELTGDNVGPIVEIIDRLDGLPLAIELAASRLRLFEPSALLTRLRLGLDLEHALADTPMRQRSLRAALGWSFRLLTEEQVKVLCAMSVCADGFDLPAVEGIVSISAEVAERTLETLVDKSLMLVRSHHGNGEPRFGMLNTVRAHARELLCAAATIDAARQRHADYFVARVSRAGGSFDRPSSLATTWAMMLEYDNYQVAFDHLMGTGNIPSATRLAIDVARHLVARGRLREVHCWLGQCLRSGAVLDPLLQAGAAYAIGVLATLLGYRDEARERLGQAAQGFRSLNRTGTEVPLAHLWLGHGAYQAGDFEAARAEYVTSAKLAAAVPGWRAQSIEMIANGLCAEIDDDFPAIRDWALGATALLDKHGDNLQAAVCSSWYAGIAARHGAQAEAARICDEAVQVMLRLLHLPGLAYCLELKVSIGVHEKHDDGAALARLAGAARSLRAATGSVLPVPTRDLEVATQLLRGRLGGEAFEAAFEEGHLLSPEAAAVVALSIGTDAGKAGEFEPDLPAEVKLTPRERQVALLVAQGHTNRQIAKELGIAEWTAVNHVRRVMRKLDVKSRVHVAQWVIVHGTDGGAAPAPRPPSNTSVAFGYVRRSASTPGPDRN